MKIMKKSLGNRITKNSMEDSCSSTSLQTLFGRIRYHFKRMVGIEEEREYKPEKVTTKIYTVTVDHMADCDFINILVMNDYIVIANYKDLKPMSQQIFERRLSLLLLQQGIRYHRITDGVLICGAVGAIDEVTNTNQNKGMAKIYYLDSYRKQG